MRFAAPWPALMIALAGCVSSTQVAPPPSWIEPETPPARPVDPADPMTAVMWTMGYDLRAFDDVWQWLHDDVPPGPERARAIGAAAMLGLSELDRTELADEGLAAFEEAIVAFPDDDRLPMWHAFIRFAVARNAQDEVGIESALDALRVSAERYPEFNLFGFTLSVGSYEGASPELVDEARRAFDEVNVATMALQHGTDRRSIARSRRIFDSPIAPFGIPAMMAMIGDMAVRAGDLDDARRAYFTALRANSAHRWPWRDEVDRRMREIEEVEAGFAARPATEHSLGSHGLGAMGVRSATIDPRFGGRVGNGSCTVCHTHVSSLDEPGAEPAEIGWIRGRFAALPGVPNPLPMGFALTSDPAAPPGGFAIGPPIEVDAGRDFDARDELFDRSFVVAVPPGEYFVALQVDVDGTLYQGYSARELGMQWFVRVEPGLVTDMSAYPIVLTEQEAP
ncbi:hypothetical protein [Sandaracinus amylolyticus]|uniref:hypothetical protein n=1 Tax=Sandaracinus amylolyticus TaxID=927083 RepID=UPI001F44EE91|nr:hypothetical protein [Sandaracinus amylolyticus]